MRRKGVGVWRMADRLAKRVEGGLPIAVIIASEWRGPF